MSDALFIDAIKRYVRDIDPQADVWLFGSRARGEASEQSDWDLLVLTNQTVDRALKYAFWDHLTELEIEAGQTLGVLVHQKKEWERFARTDIYRNIQEEGRLL